MLTRSPEGLIGIDPELRFKNASRPMELESGWKVPPGTYKLRVLRNSRSLQRRFESRAAKAVTLGALGRAQSKEKRENTICFSVLIDTVER